MAASDTELLAQALAALVLLVEAGHDEDCKFKFCPIDECPTCTGRFAKIGSQAIAKLRKRLDVKAPKFR